MWIRAVIGDREVVREEVLGWEARRIDAEARRDGSRRELADRRAALLRVKLDLSADVLRGLCSALL